MKLRSVLIGAVVCFALAAFAPSAMAGDFCVGISAPRCPVSAYSLDPAGLYQAVEDADTAPGADTVVIAPHTFTLGATFSIAPGAETTIVGAGVGQTVFAGSVSGAIMFQIFGTAGSAMSGFSVEVNGEAPNGIGLNVLKTSINDFRVEKSDDVGSLGFVAMDIGDGASARDGVVRVISGAGSGVHVGDKSATLDHVTIESEPFHGVTTGIYGDSDDAGAELNLHHVTIRNFYSAASFADMHVTITDSLVDMGGLTNASGIAAGAYGTKTIELDVARVTVVGHAANQVAFYLYSDSAPASVDARIYDFVSYVPPAFAGTIQTFACSGGSGAPQPVSLDVEHFASWGGDWNIGTGCSWDLESDKVIAFINDGGPDFRDFDGGDYRLLWNSPLVDAGDTQGTLVGTDKDLSGAKRLVDGNGDGLAKPDLGAFEYQRLAPAVSLSADRTSAKPGDAVSFSADVSDPEDEASDISWNFGDGATAGSQPSISHTYTAFGTYNAAVTAIDEAGAATTVVKSISVPDPAANASPPEPTATARLSAKPKKPFKAGKKGFSVARKGQPSFSVRFANAAKAKFIVQSISKKKKLKNTKVSATLKVKSGVTKFFFGGGRLRHGKYMVLIRPFSPSGKPGKPVSVPITLK